MLQTRCKKVPGFLTKGILKDLTSVHALTQAPHVKILVHARTHKHACTKMLANTHAQRLFHIPTCMTRQANAQSVTIAPAAPAETKGSAVTRKRLHTHPQAYTSTPDKPMPGPDCAPFRDARHGTHTCA